MSRFINLEFDGESKGQSQPARTLAKDEVYYYGEAEAAFERGEFEPALRCYSKVLEFNPLRAGAWSGQVRMLIELGEFNEARLWADKALEKFPNDAELLAAKSVALVRLGDLEGALVFSDSAIAEYGNIPYVWLARGDVLLGRRESRADYCFEKVLLLAPRDWFVAWLAARIRFHYGQFALALKLVQQALEWNGACFVLWLEQGLCQRALGLLGAASHSLEQARQLNPGSPAVTEALNGVAAAGWRGRVGGWWRRLCPK